MIYYRELTCLHRYSVVVCTLFIGNLISAVFTERSRVDPLGDNNKKEEVGG